MRRAVVMPAPRGVVCRAMENEALGRALASLGRGALLGFSIAAPVGPIGVLCIRRTLAEGRMAGLATGLGAAAADGVYGAIAALGLTWITSLLVDQQSWIRVAGGAFLLWLGVSTFLARPSERAAAAGAGGLSAAFATTFALTLTNPMTILSFVAVFAGLGLGAGASASPGAALSLVLGVVLGSAAWWLLLSAGVDLLRARFDAGGLRWVNRISGTVIAVFGLLAFASLLGPK
jgi:threonine/homoserine/homoserine lactone efflux protein